ncbi:MAG: HEPN domain-containing protein [Rubrobacter sp.]|nr:HEPN domain-containing protein [Rubrobacter sp.]
MSDPEVLSVLRHWLRYAWDDLRTAEVLLEGSGIPRISCFHAQQAAEKSIKAIFVFLQVDFPFTHNLDRLRDLLPDDWAVKRDFPDLASLSEWAVEPRYPGDLREATQEDAEAAIEKARAVYEITMKDLEVHGYDYTNEEPGEEPAEGETS